MAVVLADCASVNPVLAPARVLSSGVVSADLGSGYQAPLVDSVLSEGHGSAERLAAGEGRTEDRAALVRAATVYGQSPPGLAPYVSVRAGLGHDTEVQLAALGRVARVGARRVFWSDGKWALSTGMQGRLAVWPGALDGLVPGLEVKDARLFGGDASVVLGRTTGGNLYDVWMGFRTGYTRAEGSMTFAQINGGGRFGSSLDRLDVSATLGMRVGLGRLSLLAELETNLGWFWGRSSVETVRSGLVLALIPAMAFSYMF